MSNTRPRRAVGNVSGYRCESCRSRGHEFDHTFVEIDHEIISTIICSLPLSHLRELLSVTSESMCTKYWLIACSSLPRKKCGVGELTIPPCT